MSLPVPFIPDFILGQPIIVLSVGDTLAYSAVVSDLDPNVAWGAAMEITGYDAPQVIVATSADSPPLGVTPLTVTMSQASDFATSSNWDVTILGLAANTTLWGEAIAGQTPLLISDIKFYSTAHPDPVLHTTTIYIALRYGITP